MSRSSQRYERRRPPDPIFGRLRELAALKPRYGYRERFAAAPRLVLPTAHAPNERWSLDFVSDVLMTGRRFRTLTINDHFSRKVPALVVDTSISGMRVTRELDRLARVHGLRKALVLDWGPEFTGAALDPWAFQRGVKLLFTRPGKPTNNAFIESFNGRLRDECLNASWFKDMDDAMQTIEACRTEYKENRPHGSLGGSTPTDDEADYLRLSQSVA